MKSCRRNSRSLCSVVSWAVKVAQVCVNSKKAVLLFIFVLMSIEYCYAFINDIFSLLISIQEPQLISHLYQLWKEKSVGISISIALLSVQMGICLMLWELLLRYLIVPI